jgi:type IV pilus assembly protein PilM
MSVGLDLGSHSIKIIEIQKVYDLPVLTNFAIFESDKLKLDINDEDSINLYVSKLKSYFNEVDFKTRNVTLSLPDTDVFVTVKILPKMTVNEIKNYVPLQASDVFPENINNLTFDVKFIRELEDNQIEVLLIGARKQKVEKYIEILKRSNLTPRVFEPKSISNARLVDEGVKDKAVIVLDFGYNSTNLEIISNKIPRFTKSISIGSNTYNKALSQNLNLSLLQAEEYKKTYGMTQGIAEDRIFNYLKPLTDSIILDLKRSIVYFNEKNKGLEISKIVLLGGLSKLPGLSEYLQTNLNFKVEVFDVFSKIKVASTLSKYENELKNLSPMLGSAVGSSLTEIYE